MNCHWEGVRSAVNLQGSLGLKNQTSQKLFKKKGQVVGELPSGLVKKKPFNQANRARPVTGGKGNHAPFCGFGKRGLRMAGKGGG